MMLLLAIAGFSIGAVAQENATEPAATNLLLSWQGKH